MSNIFKIKGRVSSQFNISKDPLEQFNIKYLNEFASFGSIGNLTIGSAPAFIDNFDSKTFIVTATVQNYDPKLDIIEWTQVSGSPVSFSATNSLVTLVTTAASNPTDVVLQCTATRVSGSEVDSSSDTLNITASPVDITSSNIIKLEGNINKDVMLSNVSWVGSDDQTSEGNIDVIYWNVPETRKNYSYIGYKLQAFNKTFNTWYDIQTGDAQSDVGSYKITDYTLVYRYFPIWKSRYGAKVVGTSTPILKAINTGVNATSFGLFETLEQGAGLFSKFSSPPSVNRFAVSVGSISETDNFKHESIIRNALDEVSANRYLSTLTELTESDSLSEKTKLSSNVHSLSVVRTSGVSLGQLGN